jgi:hypothetical protein
LPAAVPLFPQILLSVITHSYYFGPSLHNPNQKLLHHYSTLTRQ